MDPLLTSCLFGLGSLTIVAIAVTLSPVPYLYDWLKRELISLFSPSRTRTWLAFLVSVLPRRLARALWLYVRFKWKTQVGRLDFLMFSVAVFAALTVWDRVALKAMEILEKLLVG